MEHLILWCGFAGAWLLVAGPISQATRELEEEELERADLGKLAAGVEEPPPVSRAWWLFPPAYFYLRHRRSELYRDRVLEVMPDAQLEALVNYRDKATAWFYVAGGAFLIAVKETWELREGYEWDEVVFWALVAVMIAICAANSIGRLRRRQDPRAALRKR